MVLTPRLESVTSQDFAKFGRKFLPFVLLEVIEISQGFEIFEFI
jgi:hypothetical protein